MILAQLGDSDRIESLTEEQVVLHFGQISIQMTRPDLCCIASMFDLSKGDAMPDERICSVSETLDGGFILAYRAITLELCASALSRFAHLTQAAIAALYPELGVQAPAGKRGDSPVSYLRLVPEES